ncbi:sensor histidine kinase [Paenibacillus thiaminolyticus]|uniref:histidine kinase n=1 Tax=Paenibacillus thiaminolyticus TaxID=49283 RepID=A0AAP9DT53_PANTH|nr:sensor histidine kinase [Paenibacillus thiaminolyticus]MCY9536476.1 sensor histidine kinase [Paenibacillus thiaminolyticus]MCY9601488.1 sensor histidine kinase [Paenibacillus thiaminolyticus]MCY9610236.1 sensor histidine kinase [Paenibacillus thiaminolyticus]MCY9616516.1 sensor histidine kinase [Paenibacillus thiaminolyticus]MCY9616872.1 sensor histidine kinase [Paenibacillus thiaminolyticus]
MKAQQARRRYLPIGYKLMLTYMLFIVSAVSVIGYVSHSMYDESIRKHTRMNVQGTLLQIRDNIEYKMQDVVRISSLFYNDYELYRHLRSYEEGWENYDRMTKDVLPKIEAATKSTGMKLWTSVYFGNESIYEVYKIGIEDNNWSYDIYHLSRIKDKEWYKQFPPEKYGVTMQWSQIENDSALQRISLLRRLIDTYNPNQLQEVGFLRINVAISELFDSLDYSKIGSGSVLYLQDESGRIMYQSGQLPDAYSEGQDQLDNDYLTIQETVGRQSWKLVALVPVALIQQDALKVRLFIIFACLICAVVLSFAGGFISRFFSVRIHKFVSVLNAFREGDLHKRISYRGNDEFSQIATALNNMGENIESLIKEVYLTQLQKKEAELEMLQSQINPHFLYNTLSSISRLAKFGENDKLQQMVMGLAKFYRLALNNGKLMIRVPQELDQAQAYVDIQKIKYGERLDVTFDIDPVIWPYSTVKLILQPFIENVLEHAWCGDRIHIRIVASEEGENLLFRVIDDGVGMTPERVSEIFHGRDHVNAGYGIRNVDQRIKLHYGSEYGVSIDSRLGIGTSVSIRIPAKHS